ncbi:MAG: kelch repeat-containing protein [bacterium]
MKRLLLFLCLLIIFGLTIIVGCTQSISVSIPTTTIATTTTTSTTTTTTTTIATTTTTTTTGASTTTTTNPNLGATWTEATADAYSGGLGRYGHSSVVFDSKMWVIGGRDIVGDEGVTFTSEAWYSSEGEFWTLATPSLPFFSSYSDLVVLDNQLYAIAVQSEFGSDYGNDVYRSSNGEDWVKIFDGGELGGAFNPMYGLRAVVFNNKIWVIGGFFSGAGGVAINQIWSSADGASWTEERNADFSGRYNFGAVVFDEKIWVIGGYGNDDVLLNDVWYSADGANWTEATTEAGFSPRQLHSTVVQDGKIWVIGGDEISTEAYGKVDDVWSSPDGISWTQVATGAEFGRRAGHSSVSFNGKLWVINGYFDNGQGRSDVWSSP